MNEKKVIKIEKLKSCLMCKWNKIFFIEKIGRESSRIKCLHPEGRHKNGKQRIINKKVLMRGDFPEKCPLEDYVKFEPAGQGDCEEGGS